MDQKLPLEEFPAFHTCNYKIKEEVDDKEFEVEELHHSIDIKEESTALEPEQIKCECYLCGIQFHDKSQLIEHLETQCLEKPFSCEICALRYLTKQQLNRHTKTHIGSNNANTALGSMLRAKKEFVTRGNMDVELLISEIYKRPVLWDQREQNHHNRFVLDKLWDEVANRVKTQRLTARNKWKALRDKFRTTWASIQPKPGETGNKVLVSWKHFESLKFLKDQFTLRESSGKTTGAQFQDVVEEDFDDEFLANPMSQDIERASRSSSSTTPDLNPTVPPSATKSRKRHSTTDNVDQTLLDIEIQKLQYLQAKRANTQQLEENEDLNFFKSILPGIKHLSALQKISYRMKILQVTHDFLKDNMNLNSPQNFAAQNPTVHD